MKHIISLGAGVQSSTMALMAAHGEITPMPDAAIFADTKAEPKAVYKWLNWLEKQLPFPVYRVSAGSLAEKTLAMHTTADGRMYSQTNVPFFTKNNETGEQGMIRFRGCTRDFKLNPLHKKQRELGQIKRGQKTVGVVSWIGISLDEATRMKSERHPWIQHRYPLIFDVPMKRNDCLSWMEKHGYPEPPRSACVFCPYHSDAEWRRLKDESPSDFQRAVAFEKKVQVTKAESSNFKSTPFLHRSLVQISRVDLSTASERGQSNLFENECEGMCGV